MEPWTLSLHKSPDEWRIRKEEVGPDGWGVPVASFTGQRATAYALYRAREMQEIVMELAEIGPSDDLIARARRLMEELEDG